MAPRFPTDDDAPPIVKRIREHWDEEGYDPSAPELEPMPDALRAELGCAPHGLPMPCLTCSLIRAMAAHARLIFKAIIKPPPT